MTNPASPGAQRDPLLAPLDVSDPSIPARFREYLKRNNFSRQMVLEAIPESKNPKGHNVGEYNFVARRLPPTTPEACLIRLFLLEVPSPESDLRATLGDEFFDLCEQAGLLVRTPEGIEGRVTIVPDGDIFLVNDHTIVNYKEDRMYWVMGTSSTTMRVADSIPKWPHGRVLDLCCGGGVQSFHLAPMSREIIAIDRNSRALNFGRFAAGLNGFSHIEFRETDAYSAVEGETFDLIACNPPFVITPGRQALYRDGGISLDGFSEMIVRRAPQFLNEGGFIHVICDIAAFEGKPAKERLFSWIENNGCDVIAMSSMPIGVVAYATNWLEPYKVIDEEKFERDREEWVRNFQELNVTAVENHFLIMRKRTAGPPNWRYYDSSPAVSKGNYGEQIRRMFVAQDLLQRDDEAILDTPLQLAPEIRMHNTYRQENGRWVPEQGRIQFSHGMEFEFRIDSNMAGFLVRCDGSVTCRQLLTTMADALGRKPEDVLPSAMKYVRGLIANGVIAPSAYFASIPKP
jgi:SAM-dependent methyltransferase